MKFAVFSHVLPPSGSGQGVMLYRLLEPVPKDDYILISCKSEEYTKNEPTSSQRLPAKYYFLKTPPKAEAVIKDYLNRSFISRVASYISTIRAQVEELKEILVKEKCDTMIACTGDFFGMPVAYLAARKMKIRFIIYSFDDYVYQWVGVLRIVAWFFSLFAMRRADEIIVPNEFLQKAYIKRFKRKSVIIRNPHLPVPITKKEMIFDKNDFNILYTGASSAAHFDAFRNIAKALNLVKSRVKFHIFTGQPKEMLIKEGVVSDKIEVHNHVSQSEIRAIQQQANVLFLPLAFNSPLNEVVRTSAPGKTGEYLASGIPILAYAPRDSFVSWYFKKNKCGVVVDDIDPSVLADTIDAMAKNKESLCKYTKNAIDCAKNDFSIEKSRKIFMKLMSRT